jgi:uncharacterized protein YegP (UPF0339 family)
MAGKFDIKKSSADEPYFVLKAGNGEVILVSEMYSSKSAAQNGIASVQKNASDDGRYSRMKSSNEKHYFNLKATNGEIIGTSEMYESTSGMENGINSVKKNAPGAKVNDQT